MCDLQKKSRKKWNETGKWEWERVGYLLLLAAAYYEKNRPDRKENKECVCGRRDREREK